MKVLHVVNGNDVGGATTQVSTLAQAQKKTHPVKVLSIGPGRIVDFCRARGIDVTVCALSPLGVFSLMGQIRRLTGDGWLLHMHGLKPMLFGRIASKRGRRPTVATIHSDYNFEYKNKKWRQWIALPLIRWSLRRIDYFITVAEGFLDTLEKEGIDRQRCTYIPNGLALDKKDSQGEGEDFWTSVGVAPGDRLVCGMAARIHPVKGIDRLIRIAAHFKNEPVLFVVAGSGDAEWVHRYQRQVRDQGLEDQVHFIGYVETIDRFYRGIDIQLLTSSSEGLSFSVLEAAAHKKPLVATAVSGMQTLIDHGVDGLVVPVEAEEAFAKALRRLIEDGALRRRLGEALYEKVMTTYSDRAMARRYEAVYRHIEEEWERGNG